MLLAALGYAMGPLIVKRRLAGIDSYGPVTASQLIAAMVLLAGLAVALFFRDPERFPARTQGVVLSGADGKVTDISEVEMPGAPEMKFQRVKICSFFCRSPSSRFHCFCQL